MNSLNHPKVKPLTREKAEKLGLDATFIDFVFASKRPDCFMYWCEDLNRGWTCYVPVHIDVAYPLWCTNADQTLLLVTGQQRSFGKGSHDHNDIEFISKTSQGLLAFIINQLWESEVPDEELVAASEFCGFRFLSEYLEFIDAQQSDSSNWEQDWKKFIEQIDNKDL